MTGQTKSATEMVESAINIESNRAIRMPADGTGAYAIGSRLKYEAEALTAASQNGKDVIDLLSQVDQIYSEIDTRLSEMNELADLARSAFTSDHERAMLHVAYQQLMEEARDFVRRNDFGGQYFIGLDRESLIPPIFGGGGGSAISDLLPPFTDMALQVNLPSLMKVSGADSGAVGNGISFEQAMSSNGRFIAFASNAENLTAGDGDGFTDIYLKDMTTGAIERVSLAGAGVEFARDARATAVSDDGRYIAFNTAARLLPALDGNFLWDQYIYDRTTGTVSISSLGNGNVSGDNTLRFNEGDISDDARYSAFVSRSSNLVPGDTNNARDIFVRDNLTGTVTRASVTSTGGQIATASEDVDLAGNGGHVVFMNRSNGVVPGDVGNRRDIFLYDLGAATTEKISVSTAGVHGDRHSTDGSVSDDGRFVVFTSAARNLVAGDTNARNDIFVRDRFLGTTERVSVSSAGVEGNGHSGFADISNDGRYIVFESDADNLVAGDTNGLRDVFLHDRTTGVTTRINVPGNDDAGIEDTAAAFTPQISDDGRYITFVSGSQILTPGETGTNADVFIYDTTGTFGAGGDGENFELSLTYTNGSGAAVTGMSFSNAATSAGFTINYNTASALPNAGAGATVLANGTEDIDVTVPVGGSGTAFNVTLDLDYGGNTYNLVFGSATAGSLTDGQRLDLVSVNGTAVGAGGGGTGFTHVFSAYSSFELQTGSGLNYNEDKKTIQIGSAALEDLLPGLTATGLQTIADADLSFEATDFALNQLRTNHGAVRGQLVALTDGASSATQSQANAALVEEVAISSPNLYIETENVMSRLQHANMIGDILEEYVEGGLKAFEELRDIKVPPLTETVIPDHYPPDLNKLEEKEARDPSSLNQERGLISENDDKGSGLGSNLNDLNSLID